MYLKIGTPSTLDGVQTQAQTGMDVDKALNELRTHLAANPKDTQGWMLLAQARMEMQQPDEARKAFDQVLLLTPNDTAAMTGWAEADAAARPDHMIEGRARDLLEQAVKLQPDNQRGLWLLGISDYQQGRYADAAATSRSKSHWLTHTPIARRPRPLALPPTPATPRHRLINRHPPCKSRLHWHLHSRPNSPAAIPCSSTRVQKTGRRCRSPLPGSTPSSYRPLSPSPMQWA
jgi:predicted Zn-dependent protease